MNSLGRFQLKKARIFNEGEDLGDDNKVERVVDALVSYSMASASRAGNSDGSRTRSWVLDPRCLGYPKRSSRMLLKESRGGPRRGRKMRNLRLGRKVEEPLRMNACKWVIVGSQHVPWRRRCRSPLFPNREN